MPNRASWRDASWRDERAEVGCGEAVARERERASERGLVRTREGEANSTVHGTYSGHSLKRVLSSQGRNVREHKKGAIEAV